MGIQESLRRGQGNNGLTPSAIAGEVAEFTAGILTHPVFAEVSSVLADLLRSRGVAKEIHQIDPALACLAEPRPQTESRITAIPPDGILIDQPGTYTLAASPPASPGASTTLTWSPEAEVAAAITIVANDVVLDLADANLAADIQDSSRHLVGIFVFGASNVTIRGGTLTNMGRYGIQADLVEQLRIENVRITGLEYRNINLRAACPAGIRVSLAKNVNITGCQLRYFYTSADVSAGIYLGKTLGGEVTDCRVSDLYNFAGLVAGFTYADSSAITTRNCHAERLQSHFGGNIRTGGHTVLGFLPTVCSNLLFENCSAKSIIGSCDDCHGMSLFFASGVKVDQFHADGVTDGVTQLDSGAKATGLEIYGVDIEVSNCQVNAIRAINPQDRASTGFSVWGADIHLSDCVASNVSVSNDLADPRVLMGTGTGFGWAPDPRLYHTAVLGVIYRNCRAINCQVAFDTWNHIDGQWIEPSYQNCAINILVEPGGTRTFYGTPCTECNPPVTVAVENQAKNNLFPGSAEVLPEIRQAYPTGNINGLSLPYALSRLVKVSSQWWFHVGRLKDADGSDHSFELNFLEPGGTLGDLGLTAVDFSFTFTAQGQDFHAASSYGGEDPLQVLQSVINTVGFGKVLSRDQQYRLGVDLLTGTTVQVVYDAARSQKTASMFTGGIGQPGAAYQLEGQGGTWLWKYPSHGRGAVAPYRYQIKLGLLDERGMVSEGLGSYVGIDPVQQGQDAATSSVEYALPRLRITGWSVALTRNPELWPVSLWESLEGFAPSYGFQGGEQASGHLWLDRQALFPASSYRLSQGRIQMAELLRHSSKGPGARPGASGQVPPVASRLAALATAPQPAGGQLYLGCWLPLILTAGPYAGSTLLFVAFWKEARPVADYDTDRGDAHAKSFMNLYTGLLGPGAADPHSAYTLSDLLNPGGFLESKNHYRIHFTKPFQKAGDLPDPQRWASEIQVTVAAHSQARYALSAYAKRAGRDESLGIDQDLTFTLEAVSALTTGIMISTKLGPPIYEGASRVYAEGGEEVGSGWIEQIVGDPVRSSTN